MWSQLVEWKLWPTTESNFILFSAWRDEHQNRENDSQKEWTWMIHTHRHGGSKKKNRTMVEKNKEVRQRERGDKSLGPEDWILKLMDQASECQAWCSSVSGCGAPQCQAVVLLRVPNCGAPQSAKLWCFSTADCHSIFHCPTTHINYLEWLVIHQDISQDTERVSCINLKTSDKSDRSCSYIEISIMWQAIYQL